MALDGRVAYGEGSVGKSSVLQEEEDTDLHAPARDVGDVLVSLNLVLSALTGAICAERESLY